jgi:hypothetical protein
VGVVGQSWHQRASVRSANNSQTPPNQLILARAERVLSHLLAARVRLKQATVRLSGMCPCRKSRPRRNAFQKSARSPNGTRSVREVP